MKYIKQILLAAALLALLICSIVFSVSAAEPKAIPWSSDDTVAESGAAVADDTYEITLKFGDVFEKKYSFGIQDTHWSDLCDSSLDNGAGFITDENNYVIYVIDNVYGYYIRDVENQRIKGTDALASRTYNLETAWVDSEGATISVILDGETYLFSYPDVESFEDLINSGQYFHPILGECRWEVRDGIITLVLIGENEGEPFYYPLVKNPGQNISWSFVKSGDALFSDISYRLSVELIVNVEGLSYTFEYPSYVKTWNDIILLDEIYSHPELGQCRWYISNGLVCLEVMDANGVADYCMLHATYKDVYLVEELKEPEVAADVASFVFLTRKPCSFHIFNSTVVEPSTCTSNGLYRDVCTLCGVVKENRLVPMLPHSYVEVDRLDAMCGHGGYIRYECSMCGDAYEESFEPKPHRWSTKVIQEPTCMEAGINILVCDYCGFESERYNVACLGHTYDTYTVVQVPTCSEAGINFAVCDRCGEEWEYDIPKLDHNCDWKGTCVFCGRNMLVDGWNEFWGNDKENDDFLEEIRNALSGWKEGLSAVGDAILTIVFLIIGALLIPLLWPLLKVIVEGITFGFQSIVSLFKRISAALSAKGKKRKKKGNK